MSRRRLFVPLTWLGATLAAIALAWFAVTSAISQTSEQVLPTATRSAPVLGTAQSASRSTTTTSTAPSSASSEPGPAAGSSRPAQPSSNRSSPPASSSSSTESTAGSPDPQPATNTRTFSTPGGSVTVDCDGSVISRWSSSPAPGYTQKVEHRGPQEVEVKFFAEDQPTYEVKAVCVNGQPVSPPRDG